MDQLIHLLWLGVLATSLDVDNALYMTSATQNREEREQRRLIFWGLFCEFFARFSLLMLAFYLASGKEVFFTLYGFAVTPQVIALLCAGAFLFISSAGDLCDYFEGKEDGDNGATAEAKTSFASLLVQMTVVNTVLSIDTVIAVSDMTGQLLGGAVILAVSAFIRFLFVRQIAGFIARYPETKIVVLTFLTMVGLQLILQAFHDDMPESAFNLVIAGALVSALLMYWRRTR